MAVGRGDSGAFRRLYRATAPRLMAICLAVTRDRPAAEDVLQGVFLKIWQSAGLYDPARARPMAWLGSIARNTAIDWYRARKPRPESADRSIEAIPSETEAVDARMIRKEGEAEALSLVQELDADTECNVRRIYLQGMTFAEAAQSDGVPIGTLKSRVRRALMSIRSRLRDD